jgi:hypothetical protein
MNFWELRKERQLINEHIRQTLFLQRRLVRTDVRGGEQLADWMLNNVGQVWGEMRTSDSLDMPGNTAQAPFIAYSSAILIFQEVDGRMQVSPVVGKTGGGEVNIGGLGDVLLVHYLTKIPQNGQVFRM